ncbi:uncharacterized protein A1O9_02393 [Exophiala aquamarina CBS 119918]|uniref:Transcription elongation factor Eaf N-terminal domain-containing protein n=1 Tax=Exophiala aquamarina CBS 119918 TaxID=1182545 RepID=A0A072PLU6_9EURO|nr:uncharacterized protein A1O9_02393 [Exophiala aquamarina CBS 119918]KEF60831.1 hypothetical protein A1O9_02393 [Exophiala aquamarina CBS 119918]
MASPALQPTRPAGWIDPRRPADYPIILGASLKNESSNTKDSLVNIRYNWQPKSGFTSRRSKLTKSGDKYDLRFRPADSDDDEGGEFQYSGTLNRQHSGGGSNQSTKNLALIFDKSKSAFVLESLSTALDMNLKSGAGYTAKSARKLPQLPDNDSNHHQSSNDNTQSTGKSKSSPPIEDEPGDSSNPFDYRHFIAEARESLEKSTQQQAGNRTPISGITTPVPPGASRFVSTTPQFRATGAVPKASSTPQQRKKKEESSSSRGGLGHSRSTSSTTAKNATSAKRSTASKPLSKETITDSDSEADSETIAVSRNPAPKISRPAAVNNAQRSKPPGAKGHTRNVSANIGSSPHIIINDDDGDLEIDMGSPEPEDRNRRNRVDPEMFRSHTGTPIGGHSSNVGMAGSRPLSRRDDESRSKDGLAGSKRDRDVSMKDIEAESSPSDEDGDVEEFELGSPQEKRPSSSLLNSSHVEKDDDEEDSGLAPTPPAPRTDRMQVDEDDDEDDEDLLAAELEAALDEEDEAASAAIGLGIGMQHHHHHQQSDESEVSEEE